MNDIKVGDCLVYFDKVYKVVDINAAGGVSVYVPAGVTFKSYIGYVIHFDFETNIAIRKATSLEVLEAKLTGKL